MDFLKALFGENALTYDQLEQAINAHNGNEANKENQIKLGNLGAGEYVGKGKHDALQALFDNQKTELEKANGLISELQKGTKNNEDLQNKITAYESEKAQLQAELAQTKLKSAIKVALLSEKAVDVDYLTYKLEEKLKEKGETLELDENDNIKNWTTQLDGLKTQFPKMFETVDGSGDGYKPLDNNGLPKGDQNKTVTREQFAAMNYEERAALKKTNEKLYQSLKG